MNGDVWKTLDWKNSELQGNYNSETDNIKIRHGKKDGIAYVFCSSNSLYKKDDRQDFVSKVVNKDKFEWENITQDIDHEKIIYITINEQISNFAQTYPTNLKASSNEALLFMRRYRFANCSCFSCCFKDAYPSSNVQ